MHYLSKPSRSGGFPAAVYFDRRLGSRRSLKRLAFVIVFLLVLGSRAFSHEFETVGPQNPHELLRAWSFEPGVVIPILLSAILYGVGFVRLRRAAPTTSRQLDMFCFAAGWVALVIALVSPIHPWGSVLFSVHMTQHEILMLIAAPLLVLSRPIVPFLWALPKPAAVSLAGWSKTPVWSHTWRAISNPFVA